MTPGTLAALRLAGRAGVLVGTTSLAKGPFSGDPHGGGMRGGNAPAPGPDPIAGADCVVAVGAGNNALVARWAGHLGDLA